MRPLWNILTLPPRFIYISQMKVSLQSGPGGRVIVTPEEAISYQSAPETQAKETP